MSQNNTFQIGWAEADITPQELPVYIAGQFAVRVSEAVADPIQATALALESNGEHVVFVSVDTVGISEPLRDAVREQLHEEGLDPQKVILNATHTHEAPNNRILPWGVVRNFDKEKEGFDPGYKPAENYVKFAAARIAEAVSEAWQKRVPGGVAFGQEYAVIGRNRRWVDTEGNSTMYGLNESTAERFDHIEGYEDHSLNILVTYDADKNLTGVIVNVPAPSQETEHWFEVSADYWCETRQELRARFGEKLFILSQCSAAGDLTPHLIFENAAHERMLQLRGRTGRQEVATRIADAVGRVLPYLPPTIETSPILKHHYETLQLPMNVLTEADVEDARRNAEECWATYEMERQKILDNPELQNQPRWYVPATDAFTRTGWYQDVIGRYEKSKTNPHYAAEVHILKLGDIAFAINPFEYYLDFGIQIKVKSPALQTFIVQLAGSGTYVPSPRAAAGGGYGAVPASNPVGPEGGKVLAEYTLEKINELWK
ncbi:MAG: hypothetical protein ABI210_05235 [Abditibacteriaceae bacterium]